MHEWSLRVNLSIFSIIAVDAWKVYSQISYSEEVDNKQEVQKDFYGHLAAELIDNNYDCVGGNRAKRNHMMANDSVNTTNLQSGVDARLTPTKHRRTDKNDRGTHSRQGQCRYCKKYHTTYQCSICRDDPDIKDHGWLCHTKTGRKCYPEHMLKVHGIVVKG
jgi:hypothetical protein